MTFSQYVYNRYFFDSMKNGDTVLISYNISDITMGDRGLEQVISWTDENKEEQSMIYYYDE